MDAILMPMLMLMLMSMYAIRMRYMWKKSKRLRLSGPPSYPPSPSPICARSPSPKTTWQGLHLLHILTRYWHLQNGFPQRFTFRKYCIAPGLRFLQISHANTDWQCKYTQNVTWGINCALLPLENSMKTFLKLNLCTCVFTVQCSLMVCNLILMIITCCWNNKTWLYWVAPNSHKFDTIKGSCLLNSESCMKGKE